VIGDGVDFIDTRDPRRPTVRFSHEEFAAFAEGVKAREFDLVAEEAEEA